MMKRIPSFERMEAQAFRRQQTAFSLLTLFVLGALLLLHTLFASLLGEPTSGVVLLLGFSFSVKLIEIIWLEGKEDGISERTAQIETVISSIGIFLLAFLLAIFTDRDDPPYFVLLAIPILQCAYHLGLASTLIAIIAAVSLMFAWIQHYFEVHSPPRATEYLEYGMIALIYGLMGLLVWYLVNQLKRNEAKLYEQMSELESTREKLVVEEKLSAVGRFASGIAHEIRNPVAMIASSLSTAKDASSDSNEREEMFGIAAREAKRLEKLTREFLTYARPVKPTFVQVPIDDILGHIADVTRMHSAGRIIGVTSKITGMPIAFLDPSQIEAALLNLCLNAIDATADHGTIELRARTDSETLIIDVENSGSRIRDDNLARVFEPFFTTKTGGTGLGLAIARAIAIAHGGDLAVSNNEENSVVFTMTILKDPRNKHTKETKDGEGIDR
jgi:two-component system, NtrC family, sensor histidine kinase HydH